jgi:aryl-alcohol dehydrogenase-like predicted oxidoreductase
MRGDAESLIADVDFALEQLGVTYLDTIVLCRVPDLPIEEAVTAMKSIVDSGKARFIGLSEANAVTIRRAAAVTPIHCIEQEWSLWARDIEQDIVPVCKELGIKIFAYSPLGRGFLTGSLRSRDDPILQPGDYRLVASPKFADGNFEANLQLVDRVQAIADRRQISVGQLALAWLHSQGDFVVPIPGTSSIAHLNSNLAAKSIALTEAEKAEIDDIFQEGSVQGLRYPGNHMTFHHNPH